MLPLIDARFEPVDLVMTGRGAYQEDIDGAAVVTDMREVRRHFPKGIPLRKGPQKRKGSRDLRPFFWKDGRRQFRIRT